MTTEIVGPVFTQRGGVPYNPKIFQEEVLRAELSEVIRRHCMGHDAAIATEIMGSFEVKKRSIKETT